MNVRLVLNILGTLSVVIGAVMVTPVVWSLYYGEDDLWTWIIVPLVVVLAGLLVRLLTHTKDELGHREGFAVVTLGWCVMALIGALPYLSAGLFTSFADAFFESMSGFTTTGASVLQHIEGVPHGLLFWRSLTHWLGGMGIIMLAVAIIPFLGVGGMQLFRAEVPGPVKDRLTPRIASTAKILWIVYVLFTALEVILLWAGGMHLFDAFAHTFGTLATGGFSTKNLSIGSYNNLYFEIVIIVFMFMAGINFTLHYQLLRGKPISYFRSSEFLMYSGVLIAATGIICVNLLFAGDHSAGAALRQSLFQVVSITTTTGYGTADFTTWPNLSQLILVVLMFMGGCAGSTGGGMKVLRVLILARQGALEVRRLIFPGALVRVKLDGQQVEPNVVTTILTFFFSSSSSLSPPRSSWPARGWISSPQPAPPSPAWPISGRG